MKLASFLFLASVLRLVAGAKSPILLPNVEDTPPLILEAESNHSLTRDQCKPWFTILRELQANIFNDGKCNDQAREALRLTFHDAVGRSRILEASGSFGGGGADGSIIQFADTELANPANDGLEDIVLALRDVTDNHNVSYGDIIQFTGAVGLSNCPGSPRLTFHAGRPDAVAPSPPGLVPSPTDSADVLLARMSDAGFTIEETVALLGAHSVARQKTIDPSVPNVPLDSTPEVFDTKFYSEMLLNGTCYPGEGRSTAEVKSPLKNVMRLTSDAAIAQHPSTAGTWRSFAGNHDVMRAAFRGAMQKLANQGHVNLVDCSFVIPTPAHLARPPALRLSTETH